MRFSALLPWVLLGTASAGGIAVIDSERIFESMGDVTDATELLNEEIEGWEAHADSLQDEIDTIQYDLDYTMVMSPDRRSEREELLETRTQELQTFLEQVFGPDGLVESRNSQLVTPIVASINEAVRTISQEEGYDLVLDTSGGLVVYADGSVDITDRVLEELSGRGVDWMLLADLAERLGGRLEGSGADSTVTGVSTIQSAGSTEVCYFGNPIYELALRETDALAVIASSPVSTSSPNLIIVGNPYRAFREALLLFGPEEPPVAVGVHSSAVIDPSAILAEGVSVGPGAVIEADCLLGENTEIGACAVISRGCVTGKGCRIHPSVVLYRRCVLGDRVVVHSGAVIGSDGFGFVPDPGGHLKVPQTGNVQIGDDVEIGASCTIDRAVVGSTCVGSGTKLDNLVQIAHNVIIGTGCLIAAQTGIAGSTRLGDGVVCGGQAGIGGHLVIGDRAVVAAQAGVTRNVPAGVTVSGYPARRHEDSLRMSAALADLPRFRRKVVEFIRGAGGTEKDC